MTALVTVKDPSSAGKPLLGLPNVALPCHRVNDRHPPIVANEHHKTNHPFAHHPQKVPKTENDKKEAAVLAFLIRQLNLGASAFGAFSV